MCGYKPGEGSKNEITWRKVKNTVSNRMIDGSLVHLFTSNKRIKQRTKLLNSYLREIPARNIITYNDYIKAKTAVLRTLSEDEETDDEEEVGAVDNRKNSIVSQKNTLRTLLKEMMLESAGSADEFEEKPKKTKAKVQKNSSKSTDNSLVVPKRPRGRPRKIPTPAETPRDPEKPKNPRNTSTLAKLWRNRERTTTTSTDEELIPPNSRNIVEVIVNNNNDKSNSPISEVNSIDPADPLANEPKIENQSSPDSSEFINADNKIDKIKNSSEILENKTDVIEDEEEFLTPHTSDCFVSNDESEDDDKSNLSVQSNQQIVDDNSMNNDDMFEEEKLVTESSFNVPEKIEGLNEEIEDKKSSNIADEINSGKDSSNIKDLLIEDKANLVENGLEEENEESLTQLLDINCKESAEVVNIYADDESIGEETSQSQQNDGSERKMSQLSREKSLTPEKVNENDELEEKMSQLSREKSLTPQKVDENDESSEETIDSKVEIIVSPKNQKIVTSPKTAADVRRNLMASLDHVVEETREETKEEPRIVLNSPNSEENDHPASIAPVDSGIDDDSGDVLIQEYLRLRKEEESDREEDTNQLTTPSKKKLNLKITCTEVVTSKYMIIRDNKQVNPSESKNSSELDERVSAREINENDFNNSDNLQESEEISDEGDNNMSLHWETEDEGHQNVSFKDQLADSDDEEDYRRNEDPNIDDFDDSEVNGDGINRRNRTLPAPTESESLKWVLDSLSSRKRTYDDVHQRELDPEEEEAALDHAELTANEDFAHQRLPRPTSIPEFIEGTDLRPLELAPSFTLADIDEDDDIYLIEIPRAIVEQNLKDQRFKLKKRKIIIGDSRYDIQKKDCEPLSCILHSGDKKNRYKTGTIEPLQHIIVRQQVRDDVVKAPKFEAEARKSVPFPVNIKPRNPLISPEEEERRKSVFSREVGISHETNEVPGPEINQDDGDPEENEKRRKRKKMKKHEKVTDDCEKKEIKEKLEIECDSSSAIPELLEESEKSKDCEDEKKLKDCKELFEELEDSIKSQKNSEDVETCESLKSDENIKIDKDDESVSSASVREESRVPKKRKTKKRRKITEEYSNLLQIDDKTKIEETLGAEFDNSCLKVPEDAAVVYECIKDDPRLSTDEEKMKDSKESLDKLEADTNLAKPSANTFESSASDEDAELESAVLLEIIKKKISRKRKISSEAEEEVAASDLPEEFTKPRKRKKLKRGKLSDDEKYSDCLPNDSDASSSGAESNYKAKRRKRNDSVTPVESPAVEETEKNEAAFVKKSFYAQIME